MTTLHLHFRDDGLGQYSVEQLKSLEGKLWELAAKKGAESRQADMERRTLEKQAREVRAELKKRGNTP